MALPFAALIPAVGSFLGSVMDMLDGDKKRQAELLLKEIDNAHAVNLAQADINRVEAAHSSLFVAGWRPAIGWVCAVGCAYEFLARPLLAWATPIWWPGIPVPPSMGEALWALVAALLGVGSLRSFEKTKGVTR